LCILNDFYLCNRLNGPEIESQWRRYSPLPFRPALGRTQPHVQCHCVSFPGVKRPERGVGKLHPPRLKKEYCCTSAPLWAFTACYRVELLSFTTALGIVFMENRCLLFIILIHFWNSLSLVSWNDDDITQHLQLNGRCQIVEYHSLQMKK
jgi:hypothetical protein